jgi:diguanylate cyclase (GGDEF)-like protein/PAS domain S-box-containing protein
MRQTQTQSGSKPEDRPGAGDSAADMFDDHDVRRLDAAGLERALESLLAIYPDAPVAALSTAGMFIDMPASVPLQRNPVLRGRAGLDGLGGEDRASALANWDRILRVGAGRCLVRPAGYPEAMFYGLDLRETHGVIFGLFARTATEGAVPSIADQGVSSAPRFATLRKDEVGFITAIDSGATEILGWAAAATVGHRSLDFVHPDDHQLAIDNWMQMLASPGPARRVRQRLRHSDGHWVWFEITNLNLLAEADYGCVVCEMVDISNEMATHEALRVREQLLDRLASTIPVGLLQFDTDRKIVYTNQRLHEIVGVKPATRLGAQLETVVESDRPILDDAVKRVLAEGSQADIELALFRPDNGERRVCTVSLRALTHEDGSVSGAIACVVDITNSVDMREELKHRATFDELTGCYNRSSIMQALEADLAGGRRRAERAVLFIDLDDFKEINDREGHAAGDELLRRLASQLQEAVREQDLVGRIGGDEFLVLCPDIGGSAAATKLASRVAQMLRGDHAEAGGCPGASVGVAWSDGGAISADELVAQADRAMYESKRLRAGEPEIAMTKRSASAPLLAARRMLA